MSRAGRAAAVAVAAVIAGAAALAGCGPRGPLAPPVAYERFCARCHGDDGRGDPKLVRTKRGLDLVESEMVVEGDLEAVADRIARGHGSMPGFASKLSAEEIAALAAHTVERFGPPPAAAAEAPEAPEEE